MTQQKSLSLSLTQVQETTGSLGGAKHCINPAPKLRNFLTALMMTKKLNVLHDKTCTNTTFNHEGLTLVHPFITKHKTFQTPRIIDKNTSLD